MRQERVAQILREAAGLVRQGWTQRWYARDAAGAEVAAEDEHAVCWCLSGALRRAARGDRAEVMANRWVCRRLGGSIPAYNDAPGRTAEEVACALEAAAAGWAESRRLAAGEETAA